MSSAKNDENGKKQDEVKLYEIEAFEVDNPEEDFGGLIRNWDAYDLAMILSFTNMTGEAASHLSHRFWLTIQNEQEWKEIVD